MPDLTRADSRRTRFRSPAALAALAAIALTASTVAAMPQLWLYPADVGPREGGHVVPPGEPFTLVVENRGGGGGDTTAYGVLLVVAVADPALVSVLDVDGQGLDASLFEVGLPSLPCSGRPMPPHGVFPAAFTLLELGDLPAGTAVSLEVVVDGADGVEVHLDVVASGMRETGAGPRCFDVFNPPGHDVTVRDRPGDDGDPDDDCPRVRVGTAVTPAVADLGDAVVFVVEVTNRGACDLTGPVVSDQLPLVALDDGAMVPAVSVVATDPAASLIAPDRVEWTLGDALPAGESWTGRIEVLLDEPAADGRRLVNTVCIAAVELEAPVCASAVLSVGDVGRDQGPASPGFWCHAARAAESGRPWPPVSPEELGAWLLAVDEASAVFSELADISSLAGVRAVLCRGGGPDPADRALRQLLAVWLNVESSRLDGTLNLGELCPGGAELPEAADPAATVDQAISATEAALIDGADPAVLGFWAEVLDFVNNSLIPGEEGCQQPRTGGHRRYGG